MSKLFMILIVLGIQLGRANCEKAQITLKASGDCGKKYLKLGRGIDSRKYRPRFSFNEADISISPRNPTVPGCFKIRLEGLTVLYPVRDVTAEFEMRIAGTPNPAHQKLKCGRKNGPDCDCGYENTCLVCSFCKNLAKSTGQFSIRERSSRKENILSKDSPSNPTCFCQKTLLPGSYDLETEMCTPSAEEIAEAIPREQQDLLAQGQAVSLFTTVYLYNNFRVDKVIENFNDTVVRDILVKTRNYKTIGCFLIGMDVALDQLSNSSE